MSDLIPDLQHLIGWFMTTLGLGLIVVIIELVNKHNKR
jgi:hypothetical protein